jgi:hypothetical protein
MPRAGWRFHRDLIAGIVVAVLDGAMGAGYIL